MAVLARLNHLRLNRRPVVEVINLTSGVSTLATAEDDLRDEVGRAAISAMAGGVPVTDTIDSDAYLFNVHRPPTRLIIIGAVHISQALAPMAVTVGMDVSIVDPRDAFATDDRFPGAKIFAMWPDEAFEQVSPDADTAIVVVTHDPKIDDPAIEVALDRGCFYVGALGSKRTHASRLTRLKDKGYSEQVLERIRAPIGLDIGARQPAGIAVAILVVVSERELGERRFRCGRYQLIDLIAPVRSFEIYSGRRHDLPQRLSEEFHFGASATTGAALEALGGFACGDIRSARP